MVGHSARDVNAGGNSQFHVGDKYYYAIDNSRILSKYMALKRDLCSTNPPDDLAALRRRLGKRAKGTCAWILDRPEFQNWLQSSGTQLLRLVGEAGIGKSMISSFLIDELEKKCRETQDVIFAYYLFDNKDEDRRKAVALLRTLLLQVLRENPDLFRVMDFDYEQMGQKLMANFDALWRNFISILGHLQTGYVWILIDAVDECDQVDRGQFLQSLANLISDSSPAKGAKVKFVLTCRPEEDIQDLLNEVGQSLQIDKGTVNKDLKKFIDIRINEISRLRPRWNAQEIKDNLNQKVGGTFLWVALVLKEIMEPGKTITMQQVRKKLEAMPADLYKIYDRILGGIRDEGLDVARKTLQCVVAARRPLRVAELTEVHAFMQPDWPKTLVELTDQANCLADSHKFCGSLLFVDNQDNTVNFIHQSAKDYLLSPYLRTHPELASFHVVIEDTELSMFESCWRCLSLTDLDDISTKMAGVWGRHPNSDWIRDFQSIKFLDYSAAEWYNHVVAAAREIKKSYIWEGSHLSKRSPLRDAWLRRASVDGHEAMALLLLDNGANVNAQDENGYTALIQAAREGQEATARLLLAKGADINAQDKDGYTALIQAVQGEQEAMARLLLKNGADVNAQYRRGYTALIWAARERQEAMAWLLLENGADVNAQYRGRYTALMWAAQGGQEAMARLLLVKEADVNAQSGGGYNALIWAAQGGQEVIARLLLKKGADINALDEDGYTALMWAAQRGQEAMVQLLLKKGADVNAQNRDGYTALIWAAQRGQEAMVQLLLKKGADVNVQNKYGYTALIWAAREGQEAMVQLLLETGADINAQDKHGLTALTWAETNGFEEVAQLLS